MTLVQVSFDIVPAGGGSVAERQEGVARDNDASSHNGSTNKGNGSAASAANPGHFLCAESRTEGEDTRGLHQQQDVSVSTPLVLQNRTHKFEPDSQVELHSLKAAERNGQRGRLVSYNAEEGRWLVAMGDGEFFKLNSANLRLVEVKTASGEAERLPEQKYRLLLQQEALDAAMAAVPQTGAGGWPADHGDQCLHGGLRASMVERAFASVLGEEGDVETGEA